MRSDWHAPRPRRCRRRTFLRRHRLRNEQREGTARTRLAAQFDSSAEERREFAGNRQAQARTAEAAIGRAVSLPERFEDVRQEFWIYTFTRIAHYDSSLRLDACEFDPNSASCARKLHRIGEEIPNNLL